MTREISLSVNNNVPVELDYFVQGFIDHVCGGMLEALENTGKIKALDITVDGDKLKINLNNAPLTVNPFVSNIVRNTIVGMVSSLKEAGKVNRLNISIRR